MTPCVNCGSTLHHTVSIRYVDGQKVERCSDCERIPMQTTYDDVYLGPGSGMKTDPNLCDKKTGQEIPFYTKQDKAIVMKQLGLRQALSAERVHGHRNEDYLHRKKYFV